MPRVKSPLYVYYATITLRSEGAYQRTYKVTSTCERMAIRNLMSRIEFDNISSVSLSEPIGKTDHTRQKQLNIKKSAKERYRRERLESISVYDGTTRIGNAYEWEASKKPQDETKD